METSIFTDFMKIMKVIMKIEEELNNKTIRYEYLARSGIINSVLLYIEDESGVARIYKAEEGTEFLMGWVNKSLKLILDGDYKMDNDFLLLEHCNKSDYINLIKEQESKESGSILKVANKSLFLK